mmetsp:Transcript_3807/g.13362  ORF Transcript_3807/g.13362 Transcript_3807/m.13362 type:complete len:216 (+) Transcript_3807:532-1179(+)
MTRSWCPAAPSFFAMSRISSLSSSCVGLGASSAIASGSLLERARLMFARPSVRHTTMTRPTSPLCCALRPTRVAVDRPCARGEPPPHGILSRRLRAMAMDFVGCSSTSASSPRNGMMHTWSRLVYDSFRSRSAAPLTLFMRLSAMDPEASTRKITSAPALRASFLARMSPVSTNTLRVLSAGALSRLTFWYGAAALSVASTASLVTLPLGIIGLM